MADLFLQFDFADFVQFLLLLDYQFQIHVPLKQNQRDNLTTHRDLSLTRNRHPVMEPTCSVSSVRLLISFLILLLAGADAFLCRMRY